MSSELDERPAAKPLGCGRDSALLQPDADRPDVLVCPTCGLRTDEPGDGTLGDAFDVVPYQWGLRGDPHAWRALRELVASTPTPATEAATRAAYVDALRQVTGADVDHTDERTIHLPELDHGGMSGGVVDLEWWRATAIPLLVSRAVTRRPRAATHEAPRRRLGSMLMTVVVWAVVLAIPGGLVGGGAFLLYQRMAGTRVTATVLDCDHSGGRAGGVSTSRSDCTASWTIDGKVVIGSFTGGNGESDVGKTVDATVRGDTAYSRSLLLPILLIALGLPFLLILLLPRRGRFRRAGGDDVA